MSLGKINIFSSVQLYQLVPLSTPVICRWTVGTFIKKKKIKETYLMITFKTMASSFSKKILKWEIEYLPLERNVVLIINKTCSF